MQGQAHFDQVRSGILLRVNEVSTGPTMYSPQAKTNFTNFFQGLTNELADKQDEEGWVDHATFDINAITASSSSNNNNNNQRFV